jgi:hypothetical protein
MTNQQFDGFWRLLHNLREADLLPYVQVIGSWAEYLYEQSGALPGFQANLRTLDVDFLVTNQRRPQPKRNFLQFAKDAGYLIDQDILTGATKLYTQDALEVEFRIAQKGSGEHPVLTTNIGVNAQSLSHLDILRDHPLPIQLPGLALIIPKPAAYVLHKCVIHKLRGIKQQKDGESILSLIPCLDEDQARAVFSTLTKRQKGEAIKTLSGLGTDAVAFAQMLEKP